jgi:hypothetical protein
LSIKRSPDAETIAPASGGIRYYFHLRDGDFCTVDRIGCDFESLSFAELAALTVIANLVGESPLWLLELQAPHIEISDHTGKVVSSLPFPMMRKVLN